MRKYLIAFFAFTFTAPAWAKDPESDLVAALAGEKAFQKGDWKPARAAFAKYFEQKNADGIKTALGDAPEVQSWLDSTPEVKETLFTALDPEADQIVPAMEVFRDLFKHSPERVKAYPNVAIAIAVTWDNPKAVYDYRGHQFRTGSQMPAGVAKVGPVDQLDYLAHFEGPLKTAVQAFPWEFLVHVVNHRTPADEREWASKAYLKKRAGIGASYKNVEYDTNMLRTEMAKGPGKGDCKLGGKDYTLENIEKFGGVCAMQADFASRVAKSLAVPAEYVGGEGNSGGRHAWVMWVEVRSVLKDKVDFTLMSEGRYRGDNYYVGELLDPKTGHKMTDRDMERRLTFVGATPQAARQADLLMRAFPIVRDTKNLTTVQQLAYLRKVLEIFPSAERAWLTLAELYQSGKLTDPLESSALADRAFLIFANFPDFSWKLADPLLTPIKDPTYRARKFEALASRYETLKRPDLACEARIKLVEYQTAGKPKFEDYKRAADGLMKTVRAFPDEGRYIPKLMEALETVCMAKEYKPGVDVLAKFYLEFLPRVPKTRGDAVSSYWVKMHEQGLAFLEANNKPKEAAVVKQQLATVKIVKN